MKIIFRKAEIDDVKDIVELCNECFDGNTSVEDATRLFNETVNDDNQIYLIGTVDNKVVAHTKLTVVPMMYDELKTYAVLNHVCVKPEYRRHNIATVMLSACEEVAKMMNCDGMKLWSNNFRIPAHKCYLNYGFEVEQAKFFIKEF